MPVFARPGLLEETGPRVLAHLLSKGIKAATRKTEAAMLIEFEGSGKQLDAALADYRKGEQRSASSEQNAHAAHLAEFLKATPQELDSMPQSQRDHVLQDVIRELRGGT